MLGLEMRECLNVKMKKRWRGLLEWMDFETRGQQQVLPRSDINLLPRLRNSLFDDRLLLVRRGFGIS